jgi:hypothetical protein
MKYINTHIRIDNIATKYLFRGKFKKFFKLKMYLFFYPMKFKAFWIFILIGASILTYLDVNGVLK